MMKHQQGSTLIIVLVILLLVTIIGTMAIRSGILGLRVATNSQIQSLLFESSNAALFNIENPDQVARQLATDGMFAYFNIADNATDELVFCYRADQNFFFSLNNSSAITVSGNTTKIGIDGFCQANQFSTGRSAVLSQVYLMKSPSASSIFGFVPKGTSLGPNTPVGSPPMNVSAIIISVLPSFAGASTDQIQGCFKQRSSAVGKCFSDLNIPYNMQRSDYTVGASTNLSSP